MKKLLLSIAALALTVLAFAQADPVGDVFSRYANKEGFTVVDISGDLFNMIAKVDREDEGLKDLAGNITELRILVNEDNKDKDFPGFYELLYDKLDKSAYKELLTVKESDQNVNLMVREDGGYIAEMLMIVSGDDNVLMRVKGHFKMSDLAGLAGSMHMDGLENLKLVKD